MHQVNYEENRSRIRMSGPRKITSSASLLESGFDRLPKSAMEAAMSYLKGTKPLHLVNYVFFALVFLYVLGPLEYVASFLPTLWSFPAIFIISGVVWRTLENRLSRPRVESDGKAIFISGCDSGFGFALAKRMAGKGFNVYAGCLLPDGDGAKTLAETPNISIVKYDVTKEDSIADAAAEIKQRLAKDGKTLWGVVANAGIAVLGPFEWCTMEDMQKLFDVNVFGVMRTAKAFLPMLKGSNGRFVITGSLASITSCPLLVAYSMTKAAVKSLTEGLRREMGRHSKVYFTIVMPTFHRTPMMTKASEEELDRRFNALPEAERNAVSPRYLKSCKREHRLVLSYLTINDLSGAIKCFEHALTSTRPRPYYSADRSIMCFLYAIINHFPIEYADSLFQGFR